MQILVFFSSLLEIMFNFCLDSQVNIIYRLKITLRINLHLADNFNQIYSHLSVNKLRYFSILFYKISFSINMLDVQQVKL